MVLENDIFIALNDLYQRVGTQNALAERAGITQSTINAYLKGKAKIENMPLGVFLRLFQEMKIDFFGECGSSSADLRRAQILKIFDALGEAEQLAAITMLAANFPDKIIRETK